MKPAPRRTPTTARPTPADEQAQDEGPVLGEHDEEQRVEVQPLHQQPVEVHHDEVLEEDQAGLTAHLGTGEHWNHSQESTGTTARRTLENHSQENTGTTARRTLENHSQESTGEK